MTTGYLRVDIDPSGRTLVPTESPPDHVQLDGTTVDITNIVVLLNSEQLPWVALKALNARQIHALAASTSALARGNHMDPGPIYDGMLVTAVEYLDTATRIAHGGGDRPNPHLGNVLGGIVLVLREHRASPMSPVFWGRVEMELRLARTYSAIHSTGA